MIETRFFPDWWPFKQSRYSDLVKKYYFPSLSSFPTAHSRWGSLFNYSVYSLFFLRITQHSFNCDLMHLFLIWVSFPTEDWISRWNTTTNVTAKAKLLIFSLLEQERDLSATVSIYVRDREKDLFQQVTIYVKRSINFLLKWLSLLDCLKGRISGNSSNSSNSFSNSFFR